MRLLSEAAKARIRAQVEAIESETSGEIVVAVSECSDDYALFRSAIALGFAVATGMELAYAVHVWPLWAYFAAEVPVFALSYFLLGRGPILRRIVPARILSQRAGERARRLMLELGVLETDSRSGVLLFLSEFEHHVELIADRGIHGELGPDAWREQVERLVLRIREGEAEAGVVECLATVGKVLKERFPGSARKNQLDDAVRDAR